ncbi:MAG: hypothetical protein P0Y62_05410 [Candidatus Chryseobacterium colombiense]|nr:hypothetical protein [Chryseobacterium sp.]WEK70994.1 MAG: hypothetical protein P0Y62_05410 [Chryseobacterium sp.]
MKKKSGISTCDYELLNTILAVFEEIVILLKEHQNNGSLFYDSADVKRLLKIIDSTLFRIRKSRIFRTLKSGKRYCIPNRFSKIAIKNK